MTLTYSNHFFSLKKQKKPQKNQKNFSELQHSCWNTIKSLIQKKLWSRFNGFKTFTLITLDDAFSDISHERPRHSHPDSSQLPGNRTLSSWDLKANLQKSVCALLLSTVRRSQKLAANLLFTGELLKQKRLKVKPIAKKHTHNSIYIMAVLWNRG